MSNLVNDAGGESRQPFLTYAAASNKYDLAARQADSPMLENI